MGTRAGDDKAYPVSRDDCLGTIRLLHSFYRSDEQSARVEQSSEDESTRLGRVDDGLSKLYRTPLPGEVADG